MKFCDKLAKKRKENNLSQELLADRLNMSRQAISKWESGSSYPDMETIIKLCKILNCPINELLDDDALGDMIPPKNNKFNIGDWFKDFLKFITKTYNMFCSMSLGQKLKCIIEMVILCFIIAFAWSLLGSLFGNLFLNILEFLPDKLYSYIFTLFSVIFEIIGVMFGFIVVIHIFKTRYLDYFITIEDGNVKQKTHEEAIKENKSSDDAVKDKQKEKVIIRDPKHSSYTFMNGLIKIIMIFVKMFLIFNAFFLVISFAGISFGLFFNIFYLKNGIFFLGTLIFAIGCLAINFMALETIYDIVFDRTYQFLRQFITFISGLLLIGFGLAISFNSYLKFNTKVDSTPYVQSTTEYIEMSNDLVLMDLNEYEIIIDESLNNIKIVFDNYKGTTRKVYEYEDSSYRIVDTREVHNMIDSFNLLMELIKDKNSLNHEYEETTKIYMSEKNLNIIDKNYHLYND